MKQAHQEMGCERNKALGIKAVIVESLKEFIGQNLVGMGVLLINRFKNLNLKGNERDINIDFEKIKKIVKK